MAQNALKKKNISLGVILGSGFLLLHVLYFFNPDCFREHHLVENLQAVLLLLTALSCFIRSRQIGWRQYRLFFLGAGIGFVFIFLEEINYGQSIFHIQSPAFFIKYNVYHEINIHNIVKKQLERIMIAVFILYALFNLYDRNMLRIAGIPPLDMVKICIFFGINLGNCLSLILYEKSYVAYYYTELYELLSYLFFFILINIRPSQW